MRSSWKSIVLGQVNKFKFKKVLNHGLNMSRVVEKVLIQPNFKESKDSLKRSRTMFSFNKFLLGCLKCRVHNDVWLKSKFIYYKGMEDPFRVNIYNGRQLVSVLVNESKHGGRFGEFIMTKGKKLKAVSKSAKSKAKR